MSKSIFTALPIVAAHYGRKFGIDVKVGVKSEPKTDGEVIYLPDTDNARVWGLLIHEAAHIRLTSFENIPTHPLVHAMTNIIEDIRIESEMMVEFPGTRTDFELVMESWMATGFYPLVPLDASPAQILELFVMYYGYTYVCQYNTRHLYESAESALESNFPLGLVTRLKVQVRKIASCSNTDECIQLAESILRVIEEARDEQSKTNQETFDGTTGNDTADNQSIDQMLSSLCNSKESDFRQDSYTHLREELTGLQTFDTPQKVVENVGSPLQIPVKTTQQLQSGENLFDEVKYLSNRLSAQLRTAVEAFNRTKRSKSSTGRRINNKMIAKVATGATQIFFKKNAKRTGINTAVHLTVDLSGSMAEDAKCDIAIRASMAISSALESIKGVEVTVNYFQDESVIQVLSSQSSVKSRAGYFDVASDGGTPMAEAIWEGAFELSLSNAQRHIMIVITDGAPSNHHGVVDVVSRCLDSNIEMVGIGIKADAIKKYIPNSIVINDVNELTGTLFSAMKNKLVMAA